MDKDFYFYNNVIYIINLTTIEKTNYISATLLLHWYHFIIEQSQFITSVVVKFVVLEEKCTNGVKCYLHLGGKFDLNKKKKNW